MPRGFRPFPFPYHAELEVQIETLTNMGQGLARVDLAEVAGATGSSEQEHGTSTLVEGAEVTGARSGWVLLVPFALPGERVRVRVYRNQRNFSEADLVAVLQPSPTRVIPRCKLFGICGGCQYQHLEYDEQLRWKRRQVAELLRHMAGLEFPVNPVIGSPRPYGYRSKITPHFARPKTRETSGGGDGVGPIGFLRAGTRSQLVDVPRCEIATDAVNEALTGIRDAVRRSPSRYSRGATLLLREDAEGRVHTDPKAPMVSMVEVSYSAPPTRAQDRLTFSHLAGDFFQNNPFILPAFVEYIVTAAAGSGARYLIDAYGGSGVFAVAAAPRFEQVVGVEISATSAAQAKKNAADNGVTNARFLTASAEAIFAEVTFDPRETVIVIDPPRSGCSNEFLSQLVTFCPRCCVYVSCNPATQMRDLRQFLAAGFTVQAVQPFDLFPQTKHLECVLTLRPDSG